MTDRTGRQPLPLLPLEESHVDGAGAVLHTSAVAGVEHVIICLCGLGGTKEKFSSRRRSAFEQAGYAVVIADHYNEGARRHEPLSNREGWERGQKANFWKAIHRTAQGVPRLVDFALRTYGPHATVAAYGQSMGGDIILASLVHERRLRAVCLDRATPDWLRPGSEANVLGESAAGDALYAANCPCARLDAFERPPHPTALLFLCGDNDVHVPRVSAERFAARLITAGAYAPKRLKLCVLPSGGWHGHTFKSQPEVTRRALAFLAEWV